MKMTFRWYGEDDPVTLDKIRQIPCISDITTAVYSVPVGEVWNEEDIQKLKKECNDKGLSMEVIESVPVHEDIKLKRGDYQRYIDNYKDGLQNMELSAYATTLCLCSTGHVPVLISICPMAQMLLYTTKRM